MSSLFTINYNFYKGLQQARKLKDLSVKLRTESDSVMEGTISDITVHWKGENAEAFLAKYRLHQAQLRKRAIQLLRASETVKRVVINVYLAEMKNYLLAQQRLYH